MSEKTALRAALMLNLAVVVMEIVGAAMSWRQLGVWMFQFYTQGSNLLALAACALLAAFQLRALRTGARFPSGRSGSSMPRCAACRSRSSWSCWCSRP